MRDYVPKTMIKYYQVGGAIRDRLMGKDPKSIKDIDFVCESPSFAALEADLIARGVKIYQIRPQFLTIRGTHPQYGSVDYVMARRDGAYGDGRRPDEVIPGTLLEDLSRRDFSCGAIAQDEQGNYIDPFNGREDIEHKIIRCVGAAKDRFAEDSLRILRAIRFRITLGFQFDAQIVAALMDNAIVDKLEAVSVERVREELLKCFKYNTLRTLDILERFYLVRDTVFRTGGPMWLEPSLKSK